MKNLALLLLSFLWLTTSYAQFSLEELLSHPFPSNLVASQEEDKIIWVYNEAGKRNIWLSKNEGAATSKVTTFTEDDGQDISNLIFKENSKEIIFVRGGAPNRKGEIPNPTSQPNGAERLILKISEQGGGMDTIAAGSSCLLYTSPSPRDKRQSRMPSSA